jgi:phosphate transport system substrate-binding protein
VTVHLSKLVPEAVVSAVIAAVKPGAAMRLARRCIPLLSFAVFLVIPAAAHEWDPSELPSYRPRQQVTGTIRLTGTDFSGLVKVWEEAFRKLQPAVSFTNDLQSSDIAMAAMITGSADIAPSGREPSLDEILGFTEKYGYSVMPVVVGTGAWKSDRGNSWAPAIFVNEANPLDRITLQQLDGIFGAARTGGYGENSKVFDPRAARGPEANLRNWGQLGLIGEWKNRVIQTYGYADTGMRHFFELEIFRGGDKWNSNYREYVESGTKMVAPGTQVGSHEMLVALSHDKYGIAWSGLGQAASVPGIKALPLAKAEGGHYFALNAQNCRSHDYPLCRVIFMYVNRAPRHPLQPAVREFLLFVLSREGQELLARHSLLLPLTEPILAAQRRKLQ